MYYNMLLLEEWHKGRIPRVSAPAFINEALWKKGEEMANKVLLAPSTAARNSKQ